MGQIIRARIVGFRKESSLPSQYSIEHRPQYLDEFGSRQIAYVAVSVSGSCGFSTKARQMGTKSGPAHSTPTHQLGQEVALEEVGKFVRQLAHKTRLDIDVQDGFSVWGVAEGSKGCKIRYCPTSPQQPAWAVKFLHLMGSYDPEKKPDFILLI